MRTPEIFIDGIGNIRIVGETVRIEMVSVVGQDVAEARVRLVVPAANLAAMIATLRRAQQTLDLRDAASKAGLDKTANRR